jgi:hypothetical protein
MQRVLRHAVVRTQSAGKGVHCIKNLSRQSPATTGASLLCWMNTLTSIVPDGSTTSCSARATRAGAAR